MLVGRLFGIPCSLTGLEQSSFLRIKTSNKPSDLKSRLMIMDRKVIKLTNSIKACKFWGKTPQYTTQ